MSRTFTKLLFLNPGESFEPREYLRDTMKNLTLLRSSEGGALVIGDFRDDTNSPWVRERTRVAASMEVFPTGIKQEVNVINNLVTIAGDNVRKGKRGRKSKLPEIFWPKGEFSFKSLSEKLEVPYHTIVNAFNKNRNNFVKVKEVPNGGRGKPISYWKCK